MSYTPTQHKPNFLRSQQVTLHALHSSLDSVKLPSCGCANKLHVRRSTALWIFFFLRFSSTCFMRPSTCLGNFADVCGSFVLFDISGDRSLFPWTASSQQQQQLQASCEYNAATLQHTACTIIVYVIWANGQIIEIKGEVTFFAPWLHDDHMHTLLPKSVIFGRPVMFHLFTSFNNVLK